MLHRLAIVVAALAAVCLAPGTRAYACIPNPANSTAPSSIRLVGAAGGVPDTVAGKFVVISRDIANNPFGGSQVWLDFSERPDLHVATDQLNPNCAVDCARHVVSAFTNAEGIAIFTVLGSSTAAGSYTGTGSVRLYIDGVAMPSPIVSTFDLDGASGVTVSDLSVWLSDLGTQQYRERADYDGNGMVNTCDMAIWLTEFGSHRSATSAAVCP